MRAMKVIISKLLGHASYAAALFLLVANANAQLATNLTIDLRALSLGNAVTADPPGVSAVHYNPAGLAKLEGRQADFQLLAANFGIQTTFTAPPGYGVSVTLMTLWYALTGLKTGRTSAPTSRLVKVKLKASRYTSLSWMKWLICLLVFLLRLPCSASP